MVEIKKIWKKFGKENALEDISVRFDRGKIHGLIGRNGSGKTVLLKCICGFMKPTTGTVYIDGNEVQGSSIRDIGIILEEPGFIGSLSGYKNLKLLASVRRKISDQQIRKAMIEVGLDPDMKKAVKHYSLGMRHRLGIAQAMMESPKLLLLDEPMNGLDRQGVREMHRLFKRLKDKGMTIIIASHYAEDIDALCDTVHEMDCGKMREVC